MNEFSGNCSATATALYSQSTTPPHPDVFLATLTNTSPDDGFGQEPLISALFFNTTAIFGVDFTIEDVSPAWAVLAGDVPGPPNTAFDVVLRRVAAARPSWDRRVADVLHRRSHPRSVDSDTFLEAEVDSGAGFGGGGGLRSVSGTLPAARRSSRDSDLLADNWDPPTVIRENPEPSALVLLGSGLLGIASLLRRRKQR